MNSGPSLADSGPGSMIIGYALVGILCYTVMSAMVWSQARNTLRSLTDSRERWLLGFRLLPASLGLPTVSLTQLWALLLVRGIASRE
jgi:hypothetical protein